MKYQAYIVLYNGEVKSFPLFIDAWLWCIVESKTPATIVGIDGEWKLTKKGSS